VKTLFVLLHGYPNNTEVWKDQLPAIQDKYDVMNLALPGSESGKVSREELRLDNLVRDIATKIEDNSHERVILMGHDIGAFVLSDVAKLLGDKVKAQIFLAGMDFGLFKKRLKSSLQFLKSWYVLFFQVPILPEKILPLMRGPLSRQVYKNSPDLFPEAPFGFSPVAIYRELKRGLSKKAQKKSPIPTLFLFGENDRYILPPEKKDIQHFYEKAELDIVPGGHWFMRENPELVNQKISAFLGDLP
jgi:pimeloyl-ACP methyl ester carboxylesterase